MAKAGWVAAVFAGEGGMPIGHWIIGCVSRCRHPASPAATPGQVRRISGTAEADRPNRCGMGAAALPRPFSLGLRMWQNH